MKDYQKEYPVGKMCKVFKVSKSAFYQKQHYLCSRRDSENRSLLFQIKRIHENSKASYGSPRITEELKATGIKVSRPRVARLMKQAGIRAVHAKKFKVTTDSKHTYPISENKLSRCFNTSRAGEVWVSDITYIRTGEGWIYLTVVIDLFDRKVVGWAHSRDLKAENTSIAAWKMAIRNRPITGTNIFHSDRGVQYACHEFTQLLGCYRNIQTSMSRKGNCWDNAVAESFFKTLKVELIYQNQFRTRQEAALKVFEWIETWYNRNRRHSAIGNLTILEFNRLTNNKYAA